VTDRPKIAALPGDGIGPEIMAAARQLLEAIGEFEVQEHPVGGASIDEHGTALTDDVLSACR
jgi:3-isopropylmalate dehydrogenase